MAKKRKNMLADIFVVLALAAVPLLFVAGAALVTWMAYQNQRSLMLKEISEIPEHSDEESLKEICAEMGIRYPVGKPSKTQEQIRNEVAAEVAKIADEKFSSRALASEKMKILKKYSEAEKGAKISFTVLTNNRNVSGTYGGTDGGNFVIVDKEKFRITDIPDEYRYLFDANIASRIIKEKTDEMVSGFKAAKDKFVSDAKLEKEKSAFPAAEYVRDGSGDWISLYDLVHGKLADMQKEFEVKKLKEIEEIKNRHRLFGIFPINPPEEPVEAVK